MSSKRFNEKRAKAAEFAMNKALDGGYGQVNENQNAALDLRDAAMGKGEEELFERKMTKEEKKAAVSCTCIVVLLAVVYVYTSLVFIAMHVLIVLSPLYIYMYDTHIRSHFQK
jgi:hypothetical protein